MGLGLFEAGAEPLGTFGIISFSCGIKFQLNVQLTLLEIHSSVTPSIHFPSIQPGLGPVTTNPSIHDPKLTKDGESMGYGKSGEWSGITSGGRSIGRLEFQMPYSYYYCKPLYCCIF
jgi:hypothetical protein